MVHDGVALPSATGCFSVTTKTRQNVYLRIETERVYRPFIHQHQKR
jgi:hypothetical protein